MTRAQLERKLASMGYWWFVSRLYHDRIDKAEESWKKATTPRPRESAYASLGDDDCKVLIEMVLKKRRENFSPNVAGLSYDRIMEMAKKLAVKLGK